MATGACVDDVFCVEPCRFASGFRARRRIFSAWVPDAPPPKNDQSPTKRIVLLGGRSVSARNFLMPKHALAELAKSKGAQTRRYRRISLRRRLVVNSRGARFAVRVTNGGTLSWDDGPLITRVYKQRTTHLNTALTRNLARLYAAMGSLPPRCTPLRQSVPVGALTEEQGVRHIAAVYAGPKRVVATVHPMNGSAPWITLPRVNPRSICSKCAQQFLRWRYPSSGVIK